MAGGSNAGAITAAQVATKALTNCPNTKLIYSGYSQGAQVTRKAIAKLATGSKERNAIAAIVHFGDPNGGAAYPSDLNNKHRTYCAIGDLICDGTSIVLPAHLTYGLNAAEAAAFVKSVI